MGDEMVEIASVTGSHYIDTKGVALARVSTICSMLGGDTALMNWFKWNTPEEIDKHNAAEWELKGQPGDAPDVTKDNVLNGYLAFLDFWKDYGHRIQIIGIENTMADYDLGVCGTVDLLCLFDGKPCVLDWKTNKKTSLHYAIPKYMLQTAIYYHLAIVNKLLPAQKPGQWTGLGGVVHLDKAGSGYAFHPFTRHELMEAFDAFCYLVKVNNWKKGLK
jgi:hypothetical protein